MCVLEVRVQCNDRFFEVLPDEIENAELIVEDIVSRVLLTLFGGGVVDDVAVRFSPNPYTGIKQCSIRIYAQCNCQSFVSYPYTKKDMERAIEKQMRIYLREIFGMVAVDCIMQGPVLAAIDR